MGYSPDGCVYTPSHGPLFYLMSNVINVVPKVWGTEHWVVNTDKYCFKLLTINPGFQCSLHYHKKKDETFIVYEGEILLEQRDSRGFPYEELLEAGMQRHIEPKTPHRFQARNTVAIVFEISTYHDDADVVRIEESKKISGD